MGGHCDSPALPSPQFFLGLRLSPSPPCLAPLPPPTSSLLPHFGILTFLSSSACCPLSSPCLVQQSAAKRLSFVDVLPSDVTLQTGVGCSSVRRKGSDSHSNCSSAAHLPFGHTALQDAEGDVAVSNLNDLAVAREEGEDWGSRSGRRFGHGRKIRSEEKWVRGGEGRGIL
jgi:hypothetical protein